MIDKNISVVIPAYNEEGDIQNTVKNIYEFIKTRFEDFEIIVVDDGSKDNTHEVCLSLSKELPKLRVLKNNINYGKGYSVRKGMLSAISKYILFADADLSTPIDELNKFLDYLEKGADIAIGSRALKESNILKSQNFFRKNMGKIFNLLVQIFLFRGIKDTQCGFKCFKREIASHLFRLQRLDGFCFDAEILYLAKKFGYSVKEIPIRWINRKYSRVSMITDSLKMFFDIFFIKINDMRGAYENK